MPPISSQARVVRKRREISAERVKMQEALGSVLSKDGEKAIVIMSEMLTGVSNSGHVASSTRLNSDFSSSASRNEKGSPSNSIQPTTGNISITQPIKQSVFGVVKPLSTMRRREIIPLGLACGVDVSQSKNRVEAIREIIHSGKLPETFKPKAFRPEDLLLPKKPLQELAIRDLIEIAIAFDIDIRDVNDKHEMVNIMLESKAIAPSFLKYAHKVEKAIDVNYKPLWVLSSRELKELALQHSIDIRNCLEKEEILQFISISDKLPEFRKIDSFPRDYPLKNMTVPQLQAVSFSFDVDISACTSKEELILSIQRSDLVRIHLLCQILPFLAILNISCHFLLGTGQYKKCHCRFNDCTAGMSTVFLRRYYTRLSRQ